MQLVNWIFRCIERCLCNFSSHIMVSALACATLTACAVAPGMRMSQPAALPITSSDKETPATELHIPITEINVSTLNQIREEAARAGMSEDLAIFGKPRDYTVGAGDVLQITVWDHPELALAQGTQPQSMTQRASDPGSGFVIDEEGNLQFPYCSKLHIAGLRPDEVQAKLRVELSKVFADPQVTVRVASFRSKQVYIDGEVRSPGLQVINDIPMNLYEAITRAGGFTPAADQSRLVVVRNGTSYSINFAKMLDLGRDPSSLYLHPGDLLRVMSRDDSGVYVMGEVNKPATVLPMRNGKLTLSEALSQAGSLNANSADAAQMYVVRGSLGPKPEIFHLDATSPVSMILANRFDLEPTDIVYVNSNGLVRFSRVLNLLLPAINAGLTAAIVTR